MSTHPHPAYTVVLQHSKSLSEIPGDWTHPDYEEILRQTEYGDFADLSETEVREMALMSLADLEKNEAATLLMNYVFPEGALTAGQIQNASHEMDTEKLWEEYPVPAHHRNFYRITSLLYRAYNGGFPKPDARRIEVTVTPKKGGEELLKKPTPAFVARLLAAGMDGHALLHRLYEDELIGDRFDAAKNIIWDVKSTPAEGEGHTLVVLSSDYWLEAYDPVPSYECVAYADARAEEEAD